MGVSPDMVGVSTDMVRARFDIFWQMNWLLRHENNVLCCEQCLFWHHEHSLFCHQVSCSLYGLATLCGLAAASMA